MDEFLRLTALFDCYGGLLTVKQRQCLSWHLWEDYSLAEIGARLNVSRQAISDTIQRAAKVMEGYEASLGLVAQKKAQQEALEAICAAVKGLETTENSDAVKAILKRLFALMDTEREV